MKKTVNISLGSIVFHIEEDAHQKLSAYLDAISASLQGSEGHDEIMADIESRIAELIQPKISEYKQVITITDVEEVIGIMGSPEEFTAGSNETKKEPPLSAGERGRYQYGHRRIFRDPDDKVLGGVCSGLAYHFGIDPIWLRLGFGLSLFLGGFGFILYILLLIIIPKAQTAAEKLEMRGQPVDINNIRKIIEEDMSDFKKKAKNFGNDLKSWSSQRRTHDFGRNVGDFFATLGHGLGNLVGGVVKGIFAFIGFILVLVFTCLLVALVVSLWSGMNIVHLQAHDGHMVHYSIHNLFNMFSIHGTEKNLLLIGIFLFIGAPLIGLIIRFSRAIMGINRGTRWVNLTLFTGWFAGLILLLSGLMFTVKHFSATGFANDEVKFSIPANARVLYLQMPGSNEDQQVSVSIDSLNFYISEDDIFRGNPSLCITASPDSNFHLLVNKSARGANNEEAKEAATGIEYSFAQHDSILQLNPYYQIAEGNPWRTQKVEATLEIPVNRTIDMPEGIDHIVCSTIHHKHHHLGGHKWTMSQTGLIGDN